MKQYFVASRSYQKVPSFQRKSLIQLVFIKGLKIKHAAKSLNINYPAAKSIVVYHRKNVIKQKLNIKNQYQCQYVPIIGNKCSITIISTIGGSLITSNVLFQYENRNDSQYILTSQPK